MDLEKEIEKILQKLFKTNKNYKNILEDNSRIIIRTEEIFLDLNKNNDVLNLDTIIISEKYQNKKICKNFILELINLVNNTDALNYLIIGSVINAKLNDICKKLCMEKIDIKTFKDIEENLDFDGFFGDYIIRKKSLKGKSSEYKTL